ncbi:hypothetical protein [Streptomyces hypolithicus]
MDTLADLGYLGSGGTIRTPVPRPKGEGHIGHERTPHTPSSAHAFTVLKCWRVLDLVRISPNRITDLLHALLTIAQKQSPSAIG